MNAFGVRFTANDPTYFTMLRALFAELKNDKDSGHFRNPEEWAQLVPDQAKGRFSWPTPEDRELWLAVRNSALTVISDPSRQIGAEWNFYSVFEAVESGEYDLLDCEVVSEGIAEIHINPHAYPYGGVGPFIALAEAFGFTVIGVNEHGEFQDRKELLGDGGGR
jgi:hypothetical protein